MVERTRGSHHRRDGATAGPSAERLASWKAIAKHLDVSVRTVQRWERSEAVPVHRHMHATLGSVYAIRSELDAWWTSRPDLRLPGAARQPRAHGAGAGRAIAVLPFANLSRDLETEIIADGLTEELINTLTRIEGLRVVARTSVFHFKGKDADVREIGTSLGVDTVLEGSLRRCEGRLRVIAQLIDVASGLHVWSEPFDSRRTDVFELQEDIAHAVAAMLRADRAGRPDVRRLRAHARPGAAGAYEQFLEGRYHWNRRTPAGFLKAVECFEQALDQDPHLAPAWAGLADCYAYGPMVATNVPAAEARVKAEAAAEAAIELDPTLAEPYAALGFMRATYASDWAGADALYRRALELKPQLAMAHLHYAGMVLAPTGRLAEMAAHQARAAELDPLSPVVIFATGMVRLVLRQFDEADVAFRSSLVVDPGFPWGYRGLGEIRLLQGRYAEATDCLEQVEMPGIAAGFLGYCYAKLGRLTDARRCLRRLEEPGQPPVWYQVAALHLGLEDIPATFHALERLCEDRSPGFHWLPVEPIWDPIRSDARFAGILSSMGLAPSHHD